MNQNYNQTITLYNRIRSADSSDKNEHWRRTVLRGCFWKTVINTGFFGTQASVQNTYVVRIPENSHYRPYAEYINANRGFFTASAGDIVVKGECKEEITGEGGQTAAQILNRHKPDAFKVTAFSDNTGCPVGRHYRLGG